MKKFKFPIKSYIFPDAKDNNCPICQKDISEGQVILMFDGGVSVNAHFHKEHIFGGVVITEGVCDLNFCSSSCLKKFLLGIIEEFDEKNLLLRKNQGKGKL